MMHDHLPTAARLAMWGGDKDGAVTCACGATLEWNDGNVAHLQNRMFAGGCAEERAACKRWATVARPLAYCTAKHDRADEVVDAVTACWGIDDNGDICTAFEDERRGWTPTAMTHHDDTWHIAGTTVFDEDAHWGGPADDEPGGDERYRARTRSGLRVPLRQGLCNAREAKQ